MSKRKPATEKTPQGYEIPVRRKRQVLSDFRKVAGPLRGRNRDQTPKA